MALGYDLGLGTSGYAVALVSPSTADILDLFEVGVIKTHKATVRMVRKTSDDLRRATEQARAVRQVLDRYPVDVVAAEMASTTPYTYPTFSFGVGIGILASISHPIIEVLPYEVKVAAAGSNRATKREIIEWAIHQPSSKPVKWPTSRRTNNLNLPYGDKYIAKIAEHPADALAAIRAAFLTDQWRLAHKLVPSGAGLEERSGRDEQPCCT